MLLSSVRDVASQECERVEAMSRCRVEHVVCTAFTVVSQKEFVVSVLFSFETTRMGARLGAGLFGIVCTQRGA